MDGQNPAPLGSHGKPLFVGIYRGLLGGAGFRPPQYVFGRMFVLSCTHGPIVTLSFAEDRIGTQVCAKKTKMTSRECWPLLVYWHCFLGSISQTTSGHTCD